MSENNQHGGFLQRVQPGDVEVGSKERNLPAPIHDTATAAAAAKSQAMVQAHFVMALRNPRDWMDVRARMLKACARTGFADVARYKLPRGGKTIEGWTIRFAEEAMRDMRNLMPESSVVGEDDDKRIIKISVIDLESNLPLSTEFVLNKTVERKKLKDGELPIRTRINSQGETLYIMPASDDDLNVKQAALISKALRTLLLRLIPGDILDECLDKVRATVRSDVENDPKAAIKKVADAFSDLGVKPSDLKAYIGVELEAASPSQIEELRGIYSAIKTGEATWKEFAQPEVKADVAAGQATSIKDKIKNKAAKAAAASKPPEPAADQKPPAPGEEEPPEGELERIDVGDPAKK